MFLVEQGFSFFCLHVFVMPILDFLFWLSIVAIVGGTQYIYWKRPLHTFLQQSYVDPIPLPCSLIFLLSVQQEIFPYSSQQEKGRWSQRFRQKKAWHSSLFHVPWLQPSSCIATSPSKPKTTSRNQYIQQKTKQLTYIFKGLVLLRYKIIIYFYIKQHDHQYKYKLFL